MRSVLFVGPNYKRRQGGISSVLFQYQEYLGDDFNFYPSAYFRSTWLNFLFLPLAIIGFCFVLGSKSHYQIVHIHGSFKGSFIRKYFFFLLAKKIFKKKVVYHIHGSEYHLFYEGSQEWIKRRISAMVEEVDALIVLSKEWRTFFDRNFDQPNIYILNNIVEATEYFPKKVEGIIHMIFLGRIGERKGVFDLLDAIFVNKEDYRGRVKFFIGGDGDTTKLLNHIRSANIEDLVEFLGWVKGHQKQNLLKNGHVMILPSFNEGLPISLLEAMSFGMPLISCHVGGIANILEDNVNGMVVEPGNSKQIGEAIAVYLNNPDLVNIHGEKSYQIAEAYFPQNVFAQLGEIYRKTI